MLLHIGEDAAVLLKDVVMLIDLQREGGAELNREFLSSLETEYAGEKKKTAVIVKSASGLTVSYSPIGVATLKKRAREAENKK